ncbi:unnamed protein product, partial [marine sediment metagenome]
LSFNIFVTILQIKLLENSEVFKENQNRYEFEHTKV